MQETSKESGEGTAAGALLLIQHFAKSMPLEEHDPHPELSATHQRSRGRVGVFVCRADRVAARWAAVVHIRVQ